MKDITERELFEDKEFPRMPEDMKRDFGLFNVFNSVPEMIGKADPPSSHRKDYHKISFIEGSGTFVYAGEEISIETNSIVFLDPQVSYGELQTKNLKDLYVCVFDQIMSIQMECVIQTLAIVNGIQVQKVNLKNLKYG